MPEALDKPRSQAEVNITGESIPEPSLACWSAASAQFPPSRCGHSPVSSFKRTIISPGRCSRHDSPIHSFEESLLREQHIGNPQRGLLQKHQQNQKPRPSSTPLRCKRTPHPGKRRQRKCQHSIQARLAFLPSEYNKIWPIHWPVLIAELFPSSGSRGNGMQHSGSPVLQPQAQPSQRVCVSLPTKYLRLELSFPQLLTLSCPFFSLPESQDHDESDSEGKGHSGHLFMLQTRCPP